MITTHGAVERHRDRSAAVTRLAIVGTMNAVASRQLQRMLHDEFDRSRGVTVVVDLGRTEDMGSECVRILLCAYTRALRRGCGFRVVNARGSLRRSLADVGLCPSPPERVVLRPAAVAELVPAG